MHINEQTVIDEANAPFGGMGSGTGSRFGGAQANIEAFTEIQWLTIRAGHRAVPLLTPSGPLAVPRADGRPVAVLTSRIGRPVVS